MTEIYKVLIIEDEMLHFLPLKNELEKYSRKSGITLNITHVDNKSDAELLFKTNFFDLAFFDLYLGENLEGINLIKKFNKKVTYPIILTSVDDEAIINQGYDVGCKDFLVKPAKSNGIESLFVRFKQSQTEESDLNTIFSKYFTNDKYTIYELRKIPLLKINDLPVYISGETGTGKQVIAELIHEVTRGRKSNFVECNCASIQPDLLESTLFGQVDGAYTGAKNKKGLFELANGGTIFLDEIGKMSLPMQRTLLKVIEQKKFRPIGSEEERISDFRLITASWENLEKLVASEKFLPDLYERITGKVINLLPLKKRKDDIPFLLEKFIRKHPSGKMITIMPDAKKFLTKYSWPGNIRELKMLIERWHFESISQVTLDDLAILKEKIREKTFKYINDDIINDIEEFGLNEVMDKIHSEIINYFYLKNNHKSYDTMKELDIGSRKFYRYFDKEVCNANIQ